MTAEEPGVDTSQQSASTLEYTDETLSCPALLLVRPALPRAQNTVPGCLLFFSPFMSPTNYFLPLQIAYFKL